MPVTYDEAYRYLLTLPSWEQKGTGAYHPGLATIRALLSEMGDPHHAFRSIIVGGTNGKGSTASLIASVAACTGRRTGLHTSPHLLGVEERMRVNGEPAPRDWFAGAVHRYRSLFDRLEPTFFEATVALSFLYFAERQVDLAVVEVGMGGRLDATNILDAEAAVITRIGFDHAEILGDTLAAIAGEKAGIMKQGKPVFVSAQEPEAGEALRDLAGRAGLSFHDASEEVQVRRVEVVPHGIEVDCRSPHRTYEKLVVGLGGRHQIENAVTALRVAEDLLPEVQREPTAVYAGFSEVRHRAGLRGRGEIVGRRPWIVVDVAHNPEGLRSALSFVEELDAGRLYVVIGLMRDKNAREIARMLARAGVIALPVGGFSERSLPAADLREILQQEGIETLDAPGVAPAVEICRARMAAGDRLLVTGSHLVAAEALHVL